MIYWKWCLQISPLLYYAPMSLFGNQFENEIIWWLSGTELGKGHLLIEKIWSDRVWTYPVHNENLTDVESLLQEFGCNGDRVEIAKSPVICVKNKSRKQLVRENTVSWCVIYVRAWSCAFVKWTSWPDGCLISLMTRFTHCVLAWHQSVRTGPGPRPTTEAPNLSLLPKHAIHRTILLFNLSP